jgi:pilus assembly protein CpaC
MSAGQTLALAGLIQNRVEAENKGLPIISDLPYLGVPFRRVEETNNEIELLIMVTPELVEAMDAQEVPPLGPGMHTVSPPDGDLYWRGHIEVPNRHLPPGYHPHPGPQGYPGHQGLEYQQIPPQPVPQAAPPIEELNLGPAPPQASRDMRTPVRRPAGVQGPLNSASPVAPVRWNTPAVQNPQNRSNGTNSGVSPSADRESSAPKFMGPVGYDVHQ